METVQLQVAFRDKSGKSVAKQMRSQGVIPGVVYGLNEAPFSVSLDPRSLEKLFRKSQMGRNTIINLDVTGGQSPASIDVLAYDLCYDALSNQLSHVDFLRINSSVPIHTNVPLVLVGTAPGVKMGGILVHKMHRVDVKCLPSDIPEKIEVDLSNLGVGDQITVADLSSLKGVDVLNNRYSVIVRVEALRSKGASSEDEAAGAAPAAGASATKATADKK